MAPISHVADRILAGSVLAEALEEASSRATLDLTGPAAVRPFVVRGLVERGRTVLVFTATSR